MWQQNMMSMFWTLMLRTGGDAALGCWILLEASTTRRHAAAAAGDGDSVDGVQLSSDIDNRRRHSSTNSHTRRRQVGVFRDCICLSSVVYTSLFLLSNFSQYASLSVSASTYSGTISSRGGGRQNGTSVIHPCCFANSANLETSDCCLRSMINTSSEHNEADARNETEIINNVTKLPEIITRLILLSETYFCVLESWISKSVLLPGFEVGYCK